MIDSIKDVLDVLDVFDVADAADVLTTASDIDDLNNLNDLTDICDASHCAVGSMDADDLVDLSDASGMVDLSDTPDLSELDGGLDGDSDNSEISFQASATPSFDTGKDVHIVCESGNDKGYFDVYNSEELWWSVANGFIPRFPTSNSTVEQIYERAKDILRSEISNDMSDPEKMLAIYDYMSDNLRYDYEALEAENWLNNTAWYLEGPIFEGRCVCDSFSRLFSLLCNIESIGVERGCGYTSTGGHAWNYVPYNGDWYLTCTTWSQSHLLSETYADFAEFMGVTTPYFEITSYSTFMADLLYMEERGYSRDYKDIVQP